MNTLRRNRLLLISGAMVLLGIAVALMLRALDENVNLFYTPQQFQEGDIPVDRRVRIGGMVRKDSLIKDSKSLHVRFTVTDFSADVVVNYSGLLPDLFAEGQGVVATGRVRNGEFMAEEILAKHDENYMPPEVAEMMQGVQK